MSNNTTRIQSVIIQKSHPAYRELDQMCYNARLLYNSMLYDMRQAYFDPSQKLPSEGALRKARGRTKDPLWTAIPAKVAREVSRGLGRNFTSFFNLRKNGRKARIPHYLKGNQRHTIVFSVDALTKSGVSRGMLTVSKVKHDLVPLPCKFGNVQEVRIVPWYHGTLKVEVVYKSKVKRPRVTGSGIAGIDLGVDNLMTVACDDPSIKPLIVCGRSIKSYNQWANKQSGKLRSHLPSGAYSSRRIDEVWGKRNRRVDAYIHFATRKVVDYLVANGVSTVVVGWNKGWKSSSKKDSTLGRKGNQAFRSLPLRKMIDVLRYKLDERGIVMIETEESYTSKTSVIAGELPVKQDNYAGRRVHRGLLRVDGVDLNADVNGSCQIVRKRKPEAFSWAEGLAGGAEVFQPVRVGIPGGHPVSRRASSGSSLTKQSVSQNDTKL